MLIRFVALMQMFIRKIGLISAQSKGVLVDRVGKDSSVKMK